MLRLVSVDHVEVEGVLSGLGGGPLAGGGGAGAAADGAPLGPAALLPDELVLEAVGVAGDPGLELERLAGARLAGDVEALDGPIDYFIFGSARYVTIGVNNIGINFVFTSLRQSPNNRRGGQILTDHAPVSVSPICPSPMPNKLIFESVGLAGNIHSNFNRRSSAPQFLRKGNSINGIRMRELRNNSGSISLAKATAAVVREIVSDIAGIRNKAMLN